MPWKERSVMSERLEFIKLAQQNCRNLSQLCKEFGISRKTGYKWLRRFQEEGLAGLADRSRRPKHMPAKTPGETEQAVLKIRDKEPSWGGRKIYARLNELGHQNIPQPSTITAILHRNSCIAPEESIKRTKYQFFEMELPNSVFQMDFKGPFYIGKQKCFPLTILDDHSRYLVALRACQNQQEGTVKGHLTDVFREFGLPDAFLTDNGPPWGPSDGQPFFTRLNAWMFRLGIRIIHSRPYHPQTIGKIERLHRTLKNDVLKRKSFEDFQSCQVGFDHWRQIYNYERPHEALDMKVPASRYQPSQRKFPETLPPIIYLPDDEVRKVHDGGRIHLNGRVFRVGRAFDDYPVAIRQTANDGEFDVYFCKQKIKTISLR